jgi:hypothetical protein
VSLLPIVAPHVGRRVAFSAVVGKRGGGVLDNNYQGERSHKIYVALTNVRAGLIGPLIADHLWVEENEFLAGLDRGKHVAGVATIGRYHRGYRLGDLEQMEVL